MKKLLAILMCLLFYVSTAWAVPVLVSGVAEYQSSGYGCAPTAAATIINYYGLPVDVSLLAQAMGTVNGATNVNAIATGIMSYAPQLVAATLDYREFSWLDYTTAIDAKQPVLMSVDSNGDWNTDHEVVSVGYDIIGGIPFYGFYTGWEDTERIQWEPFTWSVFNNAAWGIGFASFISPIGDIAPRDIGGGNAGSAPVPEPATWLLLGLGLSALAINCRPKPNCRGCV